VAGLVSRSDVTLVVVREKDLPDVALLRLLADLIPSVPVPVVVAHRPDLARQSGAAGVHLGWNSPSIQDAREILEPGALVGVSVHDVDEGRGRALDGADYLFLGPVRDSPKSHGAVPPIGFEPLRELARQVSIPVIAIGGLTPADEPAVLERGCAGWAAIRSFVVE
jgi:thiamine-phosphate diphosphorylase